MAEPRLIQGVASADALQPRARQAGLIDGLSIDEETAMLKNQGKSEINYSEAAPQYGKKTPKPRYFRSKGAYLRVQMKTTKPRLSPEGDWIQGESRAVQFKPHPDGGGFLKTSDVDEIIAIEKNASYGVDIYDVDAMGKHVQEMRDSYIESVVEANPSLLRRLIAKAGVTDFLNEGDKKPPAQGKGNEKKPSEG